jgi:aminoglycoside phosphotransferase (APT) family kinase protein
MINRDLVRKLVSAQFPQWKDLSIEPVARSGWDNRTFHLGDTMLLRLPTTSEYALQVEKEQLWLPKLAPFLPLAIPEPLAMGQPGFDYHYKWSIYRYLVGETVACGHIADWKGLAKDLAAFLLALHRIDPQDGPPPGLHSFYRGGKLSTYDEEVRHALEALKGRVDVDRATKLWQAALKTSWQRPPVWVHGDVSAGNLLVHEGRLCAVIDFGQLTVGDPACDLTIAWTLFTGESRRVFCEALGLDSETWMRAQGWTLWKALITAASVINPDNFEADHCWRILDDVIH